MDNVPDIQFDLNKTLQILLRRKWVIIGTLFAIMFLVMVINQISTSIYKSSTTIVFEEQNVPVASFNSFKISFNKNFIIKQIEEIKSRSLSLEVAKALPEEIIATFPLPKTISPGFDDIQYVATQIQKGISAGSVNESEVIKIDVEAYTPVAAKVIANTITTDVLKQRRVAIKQEETSKVRQIIEEQLVTFKTQLDESELALKQFKEKSKVTVIDKEAEEIFKRITEAEVAYNQSKANLDAARKRLSFIQERLAQERKDLVPSITKVTNPWAQKLKQQLIDLEVQYTTLKLQNYLENHPKMLKLKRQISETKQNLKRESLKIAAGENIIDPISQIQKFMEESITLEIEIQTYQAQEKALSNVIYNYKRNLNALPDKELHLAQLLRDKQVNEKIYTMLLQKREESKIAEAEKVGNIRIIDPAVAPISSLKPRKLLNLIIGFIFGILSSMTLVFVLEFFDKSVKTLEEAEQISSKSVLAIIPRIKAKNNILTNNRNDKDQRAGEIISKLITDYNPRSRESEAFRNLRANIQLAEIESPVKTILITSANPGEGKSLVISNLSIITAQMGIKTLVIDADLKKPVLHNVFHKPNMFGLADLLLHEPDISTLYNAISSTNFANLNVITSGTIPLASSKIIASSMMKWILHELKKHYDAIFIDTPPINLVGDAGILNSMADGSMFVIKAGATSSNELNRGINLLKKAKDNVLGVILNNKDLNRGYSNYHYYYLDNSVKKRIHEHKRTNILTLN